MSEQKGIKREVARMSLIPSANAGEKPAESLARCLGAIQAANALGNEVCCDVRFQAIAGREEFFSGAITLEFFIYGSDRRQS